MLSSLALAVSVFAAPAHVGPTVTEAPAGSRAELGFTVEHGCAGSPTVEIAMQLPDGIEGAEPLPLDGWTAGTEGDVVTWRGGPLPDGEAATFTLSVGLPVTPGATLLFPTVQTCEAGELAWISEEGGEDETDNPAPRIVLTEVDPARTTTPTTAAPTTTAASSTTETAAPIDEQEDDDDLGAWPWLMGAMAAFVLGGVALVLSRRGGARASRTS